MAGNEFELAPGEPGSVYPGVSVEGDAVIWWAEVLRRVSELPAAAEYADDLAAVRVYLLAADL